MNNSSIIAIISCAFQICFYYCLKCLAPPIKLKSNISFNSINKYDVHLLKLLHKLKYLIMNCELETTGCDTNNNCVTDTIYSLKVKEVLNGVPNNIYDISEIYINKDKKTFNVYTKKGFVPFPLPPKSIIKQNKN